MTTYQILEVALEATFFATIAAISVIFCLIRERSIHNEYSAERKNSAQNFGSVLGRANATVSGSIDDQVAEIIGYRPSPNLRAGRDTQRADAVNVRSLSRSELELLGKAG